MKNKLVSIIIPIYNVEKYIEECIESVISQTYKNIEIILVNDRTPDSSGEIADRYVKIDKRIKVIHKKNNEGLFMARITGMDVMSGDYFTTVDSDDYIDPTYVDDFVKIANETDSDIVSSGGFIMTHESEAKNYPVFFSHTATDSIGSNYAGYIESLAKMPNDWHWNMCGRFFKRSLYEESRKYLSDIREPITMAEDLLMFSIIAFFANKVVYSNKLGYHYRQHERSSIKIKNVNTVKKQLAEVRIVFDELDSFITSLGIYDDCSKYFIDLKKHIVSDHEKRVDKLSQPERANIDLTGKRIILCATSFGSFNGGGERSSYVLWRWLSRYFDIIIALPKNTDEKYIEACERDGLSYAICDYGHMAQNDSIATLAIAQMIAEYKPDIVFPALYFESAFKAASMLSVPCVFLDYGMLEHILENYKDDQPTKDRFIGMLNSSNAVVANSMHGVEATKQFGRNATLAWSYTEKPTSKQKNIDETRLIYPARIDSVQKKQMDLVRGIEILNKRNIKAEAILMGSYNEIDPIQKQYYENIVKYIAGNDLEDAISMPGWVDEPWGEFGINDIYVTTTVNEAVGRATLEAVELGIPILIPDIPGHMEFKEVLNLPKENFYVPGNMDDFADKAEYLIKNIADAKNRAKLYQKRAIDIFSEDECNKDILKTLESIIGSGNPIFYDKVNNMFRDNIYQQNIINSLNEIISNKDIELSRQRTEVESFLGVKRSARLLVGNMKRRIKKQAPKQ